jgi:hypothetical protein
MFVGLNFEILLDARASQVRYLQHAGLMNSGDARFIPGHVVPTSPTRTIQDKEMSSYQLVVVCFILKMFNDSRILTYLK